jgi:cytochrome P450
VLITAEADELHEVAGVRTLIHMDDPQHRVVRAIGGDWFRPKAMRALKTRVDELARIYVDKMLAVGPDCDFVQAVTVSGAGAESVLPQCAGGGQGGAVLVEV